MTEHIIVKIERQRYIYFICSSQPKLELVSCDVPKHCPVCRAWKPIKLAEIEPMKPSTWRNTSDVWADAR